MSASDDLLLILRLVLSVLLAPLTFAIFFIKQIILEVLTLWRASWQLAFLYVAAWFSIFWPVQLVLCIYYSIRCWWHWVLHDEFVVRG